ncbi:patatin-like phospholipase family protein [Lentzea sp. NPDC054927]
MNARERKYRGRPPAERRGIALCLSGGGYRAALFHLGALRRLNELGVLSRVDTISAVSGGSILAAHLRVSVADWPEPGESIPDWDKVVAEPFLELMSANIRTRAILQRLRPWKWMHRSTGVEALAAAYEQRLGLTGRTLGSLPNRPRMIFCATDMVFGQNWIFDSGTGDTPWRMGSSRAGYASPGEGWPLAKAVAASGCFPPVFNPMPVGVSAHEFIENADEEPYDGDDRDALVEAVTLSDGGVYDNMGLEPVWQDHETVLVSDGGAVFQARGRTWLIKRLMRYSEISGDGGEAVRKRWLMSGYGRGDFKGAYWGIGSVAAHYPTDPEGYRENLVTKVISRVRTDLDRFSTAEQCVLQNHGYLLANAGVLDHAPELVKIRQDAKAPHQEWMDHGRVAAELKGSGKRRVLGRR